MSGYLEVKYPNKSSLGLKPFKSWKRQWCILRPSTTCSGGCSLAVYCSEAGAAAGAVDLPPGCTVRLAKSRSRAHAFAIFPLDEPRKPRLLLAAQSLQDAQLWMQKITTLLNGNKLPSTETLFKDSYSVTILATELSRKWGLNGADGVLKLSSTGLLVSRPQKLGNFIQWKYVSGTLLISENADKNRICVLNVDSGSPNGGGELRLNTPLASELVSTLKQALKGNSNVSRAKRLSKSEGDLRSSVYSANSVGGVHRRSWYSGPSEISLDDTDIVISKEWRRIPSAPLSRCAGADELAAAPLASTPLTASSADDSMSDRRSVLSIASGIYEEIPDVPVCKSNAHERNIPDGRDIPDGWDIPDGRDILEGRDVYCPMGREEPTYESVAECVYATMRRARRCPPPPLPPRLPFGTMKLGESWNSRMNKSGDSNVTRHSSLGSLPRCCSISGSSGTDTDSNTKTLPKFDKSKHAFSVFRKRLKSDSRIANTHKSESTKENKDNVETKKKKFDFTPTRDIFKSFKVNRKMKNLKITGSLGKVGETKSCEFLDETEHINANRCSKSVECLEDNDDFIGETDLSIEFNDDVVADLALPQEIVDIILRGRNQLNKVRLKDPQILGESDYMPMSPIIPPPPIENHYIVMSPRTNLD